MITGREQVAAKLGTMGPEEKRAFWNQYNTYQGALRRAEGWPGLAAWIATAALLVLVVARYGATRRETWEYPVAGVLLVAMVVFSFMGRRRRARWAAANPFSLREGPR